MLLKTNGQVLFLRRTSVMDNTSDFDSENQGSIPWSSSTNIIPIERGKLYKKKRLLLERIKREIEREEKDLMRIIREMNQ